MIKCVISRANLIKKNYNLECKLNVEETSEDNEIMKSESQILYRLIAKMCLDKGLNKKAKISVKNKDLTDEFLNDYKAKTK